MFLGALALCVSALAGQPPAESERPDASPARQGVGGLQAGTSEDYLTYSIPLGVERKGPSRAFRHPDADSYSLLAPKTQEHIADECVSRHSGKMVERCLYRNGKKHGVQRQWYEDGTLKSEEPFKDGVMHGTFKYWDSAGKLVGCYRMAVGTGVRRVYYSSGRLREEIHYKDNKEHGVLYMFYENGQLELVNENREGCTTLSLSFRDDGGLDSVCQYVYPKMPDAGDAGDLNTPEDIGSGYAIRLTADRGIERERYEVRGVRVPRNAYVKKTAEDASLPKVEANPRDYTKLVDERIAGIIKKYKNMPPVKIPLDCKDEPATEVEQPKPKAAK